MRLLTGIVTLFVVIALWHEVTGVRGVDQYWYLADTETLIDGGAPVTNTVFPAMVLREGSAERSHYFLHNSPVLHINAWIGQFTGAWNAWKLSNLSFLVATAMLIGLATARLSSVRWGYCAYFIHLFSPLAVWHAANLFQETFLSFLSASLLLLLTFARRYTHTREIAAAILFVGILCHPAYLFLAMALLIWMVAERIQVARIVAIAALFAIAKLYKDQWFPSSFQPDLISIITSSVAYKSNMIWHLSDMPVELNVQLLFDKLVQGIELQFLTLTYWPLTALTNAGLVGFAILMFYRRQHYPAVLVLAFLLYGMVAGMIVLMQNVPRYQLIVAPAATLTLVLGIAALPVSWPKWPVLRNTAIAGGLMLFVVADHQLLRYLQETVRNETRSTEALMNQLDTLPADTRVALVDVRATDRYIPLITALSPRPTMLVEPDLLSAAGLERVLTLYGADVVITSSPELLPWLSGGEPLEVLPGGFYRPQVLFRSQS